MTDTQRHWDTMQRARLYYEAQRLQPLDYERRPAMHWTTFLMLFIFGLVCWAGVVALATAIWLVLT